MLHIVKSQQKLQLVGRYLQPHDSLLLVENAVYAASENTPHFADIANINDIFVLEEDLNARGWREKVAKNIQVIDRFEFVELTVNQEKSISW